MTKSPFTQGMRYSKVSWMVVALTLTMADSDSEDGGPMADGSDDEFTDLHEEEQAQPDIPFDTCEYVQNI